MDYGGVGLEKRDLPHRAVVTFDVDLRAINLDDSVDSIRVSDKRLSKYNIGQKAHFTVTGVSEADCVENLKKRLEKLYE